MHEADLGGGIPTVWTPTPFLDWTAMSAYPDRLSRLRHLLIGALAGLVGLTMAADAGAADHATLRVTVFDYAALPAAELDPILATVDRLFGDVGLRVQWAHCSATDPPSVCKAAIESGGLALRLLAAAPPVADPSAPLALGFAVLDEVGAGVMASVYLGRVRRLGRVSSVAPGWLSGLVAAHELGHLLLGTAGHGDHGVMRAGWSVQDLQRGAVTEWRFSSDEGARLRAWVSRVLQESSRSHQKALTHRPAGR